MVPETNFLFQNW